MSSDSKIKKVLSENVLEHIRDIRESCNYYLKNLDSIKADLNEIDKYEEYIRNLPEGNSMPPDHSIMENSKNYNNWLLHDMQVFNAKNDVIKTLIYAFSFAENGSSIGRFMNDCLFDSNLINLIMEFAINAYRGTELSDDEYE